MTIRENEAGNCISCEDNSGNKEYTEMSKEIEGKLFYEKGDTWRFKLGMIYV